MLDVAIIHNEREFLEHTQIVSLLKAQMEFIGTPKTNQELIETIRYAFTTDHAKLMVISKLGHVLGFCFFNVSVGMVSGGKYIWINEMHIHKDYRSKGYGSILYRKLQDWCKENDIKRIMGMVEESEERTLNFYKKQNAEIYKSTIFSQIV